MQQDKFPHKYARKKCKNRPSDSLICRQEGNYYFAPQLNEGNKMWAKLFTGSEIVPAQIRAQVMLILKIKLPWIKYYMVKSETQAQKLKEKKKNQNTSIRFVFLLRILFRYSKINTFSPDCTQCTRAVLSGSIQKQRWDLRQVDLMVRQRSNTPVPTSQNDGISQHRGGIVCSDSIALHPLHTSAQGSVGAAEVDPGETHLMSPLRGNMA